MDNLKTLNNVHFNENVLKILKQNRIVTVFEFLQEDPIKLSNLTELKLPHILSIRNDIFLKYSASLTFGSNLVQKNVNRRKTLHTGLSSLDTALDGGIHIGYITEIYGMTDSGKTQLCLHIAINCVKSSDDTVLYIDTKGDFSAVRIQKILDSCGYSHREMALIMFKIKVVNVWNMEELVQLLIKIKNKELVIEKLSLIIIDSLACLMFQHLGDESKEGLRLLNLTVNCLRYIAKEYNMGIICINLQTRWVNQDYTDLEDCTLHSKETAYIEKRTRCLGKYWQHIPAVVLMMEKNNLSNEIIVTVIKIMKFSKINEKCNFMISVTGIT